MKALTWLVTLSFIVAQSEFALANVPTTTMTPDGNVAPAIDLTNPEQLANLEGRIALNKEEERKLEENREDTFLDHSDNPLSAPTVADDQEMISQDENIESTSGVRAVEEAGFSSQNYLVGSVQTYVRMSAAQLLAASVSLNGEDHSFQVASEAAREKEKDLIEEQKKQEEKETRKKLREVKDAIETEQRRSEVQNRPVERIPLLEKYLPTSVIRQIQRSIPVSSDSLSDAFRSSALGVVPAISKAVRVSGISGTAVPNTLSGALAGVNLTAPVGEAKNQLWSAIQGVYRKIVQATSVSREQKLIEMLKKALADVGQAFNESVIEKMKKVYEVQILDFYRMRVTTAAEVYSMNQAKTLAEGSPLANETSIATLSVRKAAEWKKVVIELMAETGMAITETYLQSFSRTLREEMTTYLDGLRARHVKLVAAVSAIDKKYAISADADLAQWSRAIQYTSNLAALIEESGLLTHETHVFIADRLEPIHVSKNELAHWRKRAHALVETRTTAGDQKEVAQLLGHIDALSELSDEATSLPRKLEILSVERERIASDVQTLLGRNMAESDRLNTMRERALEQIRLSRETEQVLVRLNFVLAGLSQRSKVLQVFVSDILPSALIS